MPGVVPVSDSTTVPFWYVQFRVYASFLSWGMSHDMLAVAVSKGEYVALSRVRVQAAEADVVSRINSISVVVLVCIFFEVFFN